MKRSRVMVIVAVLAGSLFLAGPLWSATGPLWEQKFTLPNCDTIWVEAVAASTNTCIVCGIAFDSTKATGDIGFIKGFDVATGNLKWQDTLTTDADHNGFDSLAVVGNTVLVDGFSYSYNVDQNVYTVNQSTLRAYNADATGGGTISPIWTVTQNTTPLNFGPPNLVTANNRVFVVRQEKGLGDPTGTGNCIVQAYEVGAPIVGATSLLME
ncbi:MAG: hypothetical protein NTY36_14280 [Deltaproteobacteria bacterium]|nr:hypothetical protein [Deltaproteobacteria bacterium]